MNRWQRFIKTLAAPRHKANPLAAAVEVKQQGWLQNAPDLRRKEPRDWLKARLAYASPEQPRNDLLQDLYQDALLDSHLQAVQQKRLLALQNKEFVLRKPDAEIDEEKSKWLQQLWFRQALGWALESRFFGYSLLWLRHAEPQARLALLYRRHTRHALPYQPTGRGRGHHHHLQY